MGMIFPSSTWFHPKVLGKGQNSPYIVGATSQVKGGGHFWQDGGYKGVKFKDSAGHCFALRDKILMNFLNCCDYKIENVHHRQNFWLHLSKSY